MGGSFLSIGRYVPRVSVVHTLDARAKLLASLLFALGAVTAGTVWGQGLFFVVLLAGFGWAGLPVQVLLRGLRGAFWILLFVALANLGWAFVTQRVDWAGGEATILQASELVVLLLRLLNLLVLAALFTATTVPVDAAEGLERLLAPLARVRVPVHEVGMLLVLALSFIPIFLSEAEHLVDAHRVKRGLARWSWTDRIRAVVPLVVPLFLSVLRRADELAVALESRCFSPGRKRTSLVPGHVGRAEWVLVVTSVVAALTGTLWF